MATTRSKLLRKPQERNYFYQKVELEMIRIQEDKTDGRKNWSSLPIRVI